MRWHWTVAVETLQEMKSAVGSHLTGNKDILIRLVRIKSDHKKHNLTLGLESVKWANIASYQSNQIHKIREVSKYLINLLRVEFVT